MNASSEESSSGEDLTRTIGWPAHVAAGACLLLYLTCFVFLFSTQQPAFREADFASFYLAGRILLDRPPAELFDLEAQRAFQQQIGDFSFKPYIHPPFEAFLFLPFALVRYDAALWIWFGLNFLSLAVLPWVLPRLYPGFAVRNPLLLAVCIISFYPFYLCLLNGQDSILFLWVLLLLFSRWRLGQHGLAGSLLGLTFIKPHLAVLIALPLLIQRKSRGLIGLTVCGSILWLATAAWLGAGWTFTYVDLLKEVGSHDSLAARQPDPMNSQSPASARAHLRQLPATMHNWIGQLSALGFDQVHSFAGAGVLALLASVVQIFIWTVKTAPLDPRLSLRFAATTLLALLASFHLYMYDLAIAFLPLLFCLEYTFCRRDLRVRILQLFVGSSLLAWIYPSIRLSSVEFKTTVIWMSSLLIAILIDLSAKANSTLHSVHANPEGPIGRTFAD